MHRKSPAQRSIAGFLLVVVVATTVVTPVGWAVSTSFKPKNEVLAAPPSLLPRNLTFENYDAVWSQGGILALGNSALVATGTVVLAAGLGLLGGYGLSRARIRGTGILVMFMAAALAVPLYSLLAPIQMIATRLGLTDNLLTLIFLYTSVSIPFVVWLMKSQTDSVPRELEQAAAVDGYGRLDALRRIVLPSLKPGLIAASVFALQTAWNDFVIANVLSSEPGVRTLPVALKYYQGTFGVEWGPLMAGAVLATLPPVVLFLIFRRHVTQGLAGGAVKG